MPLIRTTSLLGFLLLLFLAGEGPVLGSTIGLSSPVPAAQVDSPAARGFSALEKGDLTAAEQAFQAGLAENPQDPQYLLGLADVALRLNQERKVEDFLQRALQAAPESSQVQTAWGRYHYSRQRYAEAEESLNKAIELDPAAVAPLVDLGTLYVKGLKQPEKAVPLYRAALSLAPYHAGAHFALGTTLAALGENRDAIGELKEAARLSPDNPLPHQALGGVFVADKLYSQALSAYDTALQINPRMVDVLMSRGDLLAALGDNEKALMDYQRVREIAPKFPQVLVKIGMLYQQLKKYPEAKNTYLDAIELDDKIALAYNNLAYLATETGEDLDNALVWANVAVELAPEAETFQDTLGWVHRARGETEQALAVLKKTAQRENPAGETLYHLGLIYKERADYANALETFRKALAARGTSELRNEVRRLMAELK